MENTRGEDGVGFVWHIQLKFFRGREGQAAFAVEEFFQPPVTGTVRASNNFRSNTVSQFAPIPPPFQPVFVADRTFYRDAGDF